eukprot:3247238-Rhodomonas_salina.2
MVNKNKNSTSSNDGVVGLVFIVRDLSHVFPDAKGKRAWVRRTEVGSAAAAEGKLEAGDELIRIGDTDRIFVSLPLSPFSSSPQPPSARKVCENVSYRIHLRIP